MMLTERRVLATGGAGLIGSHPCHRPLCRQIHEAVRLEHFKNILGGPGIRRRWTGAIEFAANREKNREMHFIRWVNRGSTFSAGRPLYDKAYCMAKLMPRVKAACGLAPEPTPRRLAVPGHTVGGRSSRRAVRSNAPAS